MMAPAAQQYTLVGFTEDLDWNPLQFVKPLPRNRQCSVCGLVRRTTANLPCGHVACRCCYEQCEAAEGYDCPIDGEHCLEEDVGWIHFPVEYLLNRKVKCWNQRHGCPLVMAASEVHKHFHQECEYHCTSCPRCSLMVLCQDVGEHLKASCNAHAAPQATECEEKPSDATVTEILEGVRKVVQEEAGEMKALLVRAFGENVSLNESLTEVSQSVNIFKESVKQEIGRKVSQSVNSLKETVSEGMAPVGQMSEITHCLLDGINTLRGVLKSEMADMKKQIVEEIPQVRAAIESAKENAGASAKRMLELQKKAMAYTEKNEMRCDFFIRDIQSLEAKALKEGESEYVHGQVYLLGYNISPGATLTRMGKLVFLTMTLRLNKGDYDDSIQWPFDYRIRVTILHPHKNEEKVITFKSNRSLALYEQASLSRIKLALFGKYFLLGDLKTEGYVCNDMLHVRWELL